MRLSLSDYSAQIEEAIKAYESDYREKTGTDLPVMLRHYLSVRVADFAVVSSRVFFLSFSFFIIKAKDLVNKDSSWSSAMAPREMYQIASELERIFNGYTFSDGTVLSGGEAKPEKAGEDIWCITSGFSAREFISLQEIVSNSSRSSTSEA